MDRNCHINYSYHIFGIITTLTCKAPLNIQLLWLHLSSALGLGRISSRLSVEMKSFHLLFSMLQACLRAFLCFYHNQCLRGREGKTIVTIVWEPKLGYRHACWGSLLWLPCINTDTSLIKLAYLETQTQALAFLGYFIIIVLPRNLEKLLNHLQNLLEFK